MRSARSSTEHQEAVSRRLALLGAELAAARAAEAQRRGAATDEVAAPDTHTRIRPGRFEPPRRPEPPPFAEDASRDPVGGEPGGWPVPVPGRHAARRRRDPLPGAARVRSAGRVLGSTWGPAQLTVVAVLVAVGLAATCWWLLRSRPEQLPVLPPASSAGLVTPVGMSPASTTTPATGAATDDGAVVVDVAGKVRHPGIVVLRPGDRVVDAIKAAGGARHGVDLTSLNLARQLVDGEQILVGLAAPTGVAASAGAPPAGTPVSALVNLNTADQTQLEALPEIGPVTAQAILGWRDQHGGFTSVDQLLDVDGIGEATLSQIAPLVTV